MSGAGAPPHSIRNNNDFSLASPPASFYNCRNQEIRGGLAPAPAREHHMLKWIAGGKVDHPMGDIRKAREIVDDLPANDASKALDEIVYWLDSLNHTEGFSPERRFENIDLLDAAAKIHQRKLSQDYLAVERQQKFRENNLWKGVFGFWKNLGDAYLKCVAQYESGTTSATSIKKSLPVIVARGLRALTLQLKWTLLRYGLVEPRIWSEIARLYQLAEAGGFADSMIAVYPGSHGQSSARREFLKAMMLSASSTDGLTPLSQEIAERAVAHFSDLFQIEKTPMLACSYYFDLAEAKAPARMIKSTTTAATRRYFSAGTGLVQLRQLLLTVAGTGYVPADVNLGGTYGKDVLISVLKHLVQYWSDSPPARDSERRKIATRITVVPGFSEILAMLDPAHSNNLDFSQDQSAESWIVENVSDGGYGAIIPAEKSDWIKVGGLIGVQTETSIYWGIGLIRRVSSDQYQQRRVGIQLLSKTALPIRLVFPASNSRREPDAAILLSTSPDRTGEIGVLMREGTFNPQDSLDMMVNSKTYLLIPSRMVEGGDDFDWAKFKVMQRAE